MTELPTPEPVSVTSLSPTAATDLLACPYRLAWRLDPRYRALRRPSPWSSLGVVAHAVVEDVAKGLLKGITSDDEARARVEARWDDRVTAANSVLAATWKPASPPSPEEWPGYHLVRARTVRRALRQWGSPRSPSPVGSTTHLVEESFEVSSSGLSGRPDRVEGVPGNLCVVDLKTGLAQAGPTDNQRRQLLVYCHLVGVTSGDMPTRVAIEDPAGRRWEQAVTREDIAAVVQEIQAARVRYELAMASRSPADMATPGESTCRHCAFRVVCGPYWLALETSWEHGSVTGRVSEVRTSKQGSTVLIDATAPRDAAGADWIVTAIPEDSIPKPGFLSVADAEVTGSPRHLRWRWSTMTWLPLNGQP